MTVQANKSFVAKITLKTNTYYVADRPDVTLDAENYQNVVRSWSDISYNSDTLEGQFQIGGMDIELINGEEFLGNGYNFSPTDVWNNYDCDVRIFTDGNVEFDQCEKVFSGKIKNYAINENIISFTVEQIDYRDDILLPKTVCEDNTVDVGAMTRLVSYHLDSNYIVMQVGQADIFKPGDMVVLHYLNTYPDTIDIYPFQYARIKDIENDVLILYETLNYTNRIWLVEKAFRNIPKEFIGKTLPIQIGDLDDEDNGVFGKTITPSNASGKRSVVYDGSKMNSNDYIGVWDDGAKRFYQAIKFSSQSSILLIDVPVGSTNLWCDNIGFFNVGDYIEITDGTNTETRRITNLSTTVLNVGFYPNYPIGQITFDPQVTNAYSSTVSSVNVKLGEYETVPNKNGINFGGNKTLHIVNTMNATDDFSVLSFTNDEIKEITYYDEDHSIVDNTKKIISQTVLLIDSELMLVVSRPDLTTNSLYVERGYNGTTKATHDSGSNVIIAETFGAKNLLVFREKFDANGGCNFNYTQGSYGNGGGYYESEYATPDEYLTNPLSNMFDGNEATYCTYSYKIDSTVTLDSNLKYAHLSFNCVFPHIDIDATVIKVSPAIKGNFDIDGSFGNSPVGANIDTEVGAMVLLINSSMRYEEDFIDENNKGVIHYFKNLPAANLPFNLSINSYTAYDSAVGMFSFTDNTIVDDEYNYNMTLLKDLNNMPRLFFIVSQRYVGAGSGIIPGADITYEFRVYNIGLWCDFFVDYTKHTIVAPLKGREITSDVNTITGGTTGNLCKDALDVCALLLTEELGYETTDFTSRWGTVGTATECAFSYGVDDDRIKGFEFVSEIANHYNYILFKSYDGKIDIANLYTIYNTTPVGNKIEIDDILFLERSGQRRITIHQTGTDLIYNDIIIKYKRNNSTDEYQAAYVLPKTYTLSKSGITLEEARDVYYGSKTRTLEIESPYIYTESEAQNLAETKADEYAEVHFYVELFIDYDHYSEVNSLSEQYRIGDIIYLNGSCNGITFDINRKFYISSTTVADSGRELGLSLKSVDPVSEF